MALGEITSWDQRHAAIGDLALLRKLAGRFDPRIVQPDELAREAFYRVSELLTALERIEQRRAHDYRQAQMEIADHAIRLMQQGERNVPDLIQGVLSNFGLHDPDTEATEAKSQDRPAGVEE